MKVFGHYWEVVHAKTGQVVNSGFEKGDSLVPGQSPDKNVKGFNYRVIPLYAPEDGAYGYMETEADIEDSYGRGERDFVQGGRLKNSYQKASQPISHRCWAAAVAACRANNR